MRLGFYYHIPAIEKDSAIWMPGYLGRFIDTLAGHFTNVTLFQHLPDPGDNTILDYKIEAGNVNLVSLPPRGSVPNRTIHAKKYTKLLQTNLNCIDALLIRGPTPLLPALFKAANHLPTILLIVGDYLAGVNSLPQPRWRKELIRIWSWYNYLGQLKAIKHSLVIVNSHTLSKKYAEKAKTIIETRTTTISEQDFFQREDTCLNRPIHLLYAGRMDPAKGIFDILDALAILVRQGEDIILDLVGWAEQGSDILKLIEKKTADLDIRNNVIFHGYKAVGPELFAFYKSADIYLLASQSSFEGFPRTIWEAMAHCVPVVATKVGSIPDFISGAAELVEPKDPVKLAAAVVNIINSEVLRKKYIQKGFSLATQNTLEFQVGSMTKSIKEWMNINE